MQIEMLDTDDFKVNSTGELHFLYQSKWRGLKQEPGYAFVKQWKDGQRGYLPE